MRDENERVNVKLRSIRPERPDMVSDTRWQDDASIPRYRSSAAARMVNLSVATLRVWERRYQVVGPVQAPSGHRLYSSQDVRRLVLIKQLVDQGNGIGSLARMETARLQAMVDEVAGVVATVANPDASPRTRQHGLRVLLVGQNLNTRHEQALRDLGDVEVVARLSEGPELELMARALHADLVLVDVGALHQDTAQALMRVQRTVGARHMVVAYGFSSTLVLESLRARAVSLRRTPMTADEAVNLVKDHLRSLHSVARPGVDLPKLAPPTRFDAESLQALVQAMPRVACECPTHLAEIVTVLGQFEQYSADCETRQPADVALHAYLYRVAGQARALMEEALVTLARAEGVPLPGETALGS